VIECAHDWYAYRQFGCLVQDLGGIPHQAQNKEPRYPKRNQQVKMSLSDGPASKRYTLVLSEAFKDPQTQEKPCVTASDEAFLVAYWENWYDHWLYKWDCKAKKVQMDEKHKHFATPYTAANLGQKKFGGWLVPGRNAYKNYLEMVKEGREKPRSKELEAEALATLRVDNDMEAKEKKRAESKKKRKKKTDVVVEEEVDVDYEDLDQWD
jgi:hypothetical protein